MSEVEIIPATAKLIEDYYGKQIPQSVRAYVAIADDQVLGIAGFYVTATRLIMFSELKDELKCNKRIIIRGMRKMRQIAREMKLPIHAVAQKELPTAPSFLEHFGFVKIGQELYEWQIR